MFRRALTGALLLAAACVHAQSSDPLHSPECVAVRDTLTSAQRDAAAKRAGAAEKLAAARNRVKLVCLGRDSGNAQRVGAPDPRIAVPPPQIEMPQPRPVVVAPPPVAPPPPLAIPRPSAITNCDPGGCWDSDGRRLNQLGPMLVGPRGACTVIGGTVQCP